MKDYYLILGVSREATTRQIRRAFRRRVKELHPDVGGPTADAAAFRDVTEAYETLGRPERRRSYDALLARRESPPPPPPRRARPARARPHGAGLEIALEVVLSPREARRGGVFPLRLPVGLPCGACGGRGGYAGVCPRCGGWGFRETRLAFDLVLPPGVPTVARLRCALDAWGVPGARLTILLRTAPGVPD